MNTTQDEYLESLWYLREQDKDSLADLQTALDAPIDYDKLEGIVFAEMAVFNRKTGKVALTELGLDYARGLVRKHRLAERLLYDVLGFRNERFESEACTFEHLVAPHVVDGICTLLGHPRECPHGLPIPEGPCCVRNDHVSQSSVAHLSELEVGESGRVAYVNCQDDSQLHRLNGLQIKPGVEIRVHQKYPAWVVECEGGMIAIDKRVADRICLWKQQTSSAPEGETEPRMMRPGPKWRFWRRASRRTSDSSRRER